MYLDSLVLETLTPSWEPLKLQVVSTSRWSNLLRLRLQSSNDVNVHSYILKISDYRRHKSWTFSLKLKSTSLLLGRFLFELLFSLLETISFTHYIPDISGFYVGVSGMFGSPRCTQYVLISLDPIPWCLSPSPNPGRDGHRWWTPVISGSQKNIIKISCLFF